MTRVRGKLVLFDIDGTLLDTHGLGREGLRKAGRAATRILGAAARVLTLGVRILSAGRPDPAGALLPRDL